MSVGDISSIMVIVAWWASLGALIFELLVKRKDSIGDIITEQARETLRRDELSKKFGLQIAFEAILRIDGRALRLTMTPMDKVDA